MKDKFCVAGWDVDEGRMKRLLINGGYWDTTNLASIGTWYSLITVNTSLLDSPRDYPQRTDDVNIEHKSSKVVPIRSGSSCRSQWLCIR
jgi:hypothetical protein